MKIIAPYTHIDGAKGTVTAIIGETVYLSETVYHVSIDGHGCNFLRFIAASLIKLSPLEMLAEVI